jgi:hypothetical protein
LRLNDHGGRELPRGWSPSKTLPFCDEVDAGSRLSPNGWD